MLNNIPKSRFCKKCKILLFLRENIQFFSIIYFGGIYNITKKLFIRSYKMKKRILAMVLSILTIVSFSIQISAMPTNDQISPYWNNMSTVNIDIEFSDDNIGNASVMITKIHNVTTLIEADFYIYYKTSNGGWRYLDETSGSSNGSLYLELEFDAVSGREYRAKAVITAYSGSSSESETLYATRTCP